MDLEHPGEVKISDFDSFWTPLNLVERIHC